MQARRLRYVHECRGSPEERAEQARAKAVEAFERRQGTAKVSAEPAKRANFGAMFDDMLRQQYLR